MGTITPQELFKAWTLETTSVEMTLGHVLQNLVKQQTTMEALHQTLFNLRTDVDRLLALTGTQPNVKIKKTLKRRE